MHPVKGRKPQRNSVRTGCVTCKQRHVKCPEERPHCSRCTKGGFICAGYAVPTARIFKSSAEIQTETNNKHSDSPGDIPSTGSSIPATTPRSGRGSISISSPLQLGNSDPFSTLPVRFGPRETYLLRKYPALVEIRNTTLMSRHSVHLPTSTYWSQHGICLEDEAAAYGLLARNAAMQHVRLNGSSAAPSASLIEYTTMTQAALHRKLAHLDHFETPETVCAIMWASGLLGVVDLLIGSPTMHLHSRAMSRMIVRYVELIGDDMRLEPILYLLYADSMRALSTMTRPMLDTTEWLPRFFQNTWKKAAALYPIRESADSKSHIHDDVKDVIIQEIILHERAGGTRYLDLQNEDMDGMDAILVANTVRSQELWRYGQVLNIVIDAMESLRRLDSTSRKIPELIQDQSARVCISISMLLWMSFTSPTSFASNGFMDTIPCLLKHLRKAIIESKSHQKTSLDQEQPHAVAKLWALFVGLHTECQHRDMFNADLLHGMWFFEAFRKQAESMRICSWQDSVILLRQILYINDMTPHISEWWPLAFPGVQSESDVSPALSKPEPSTQPPRPRPGELFRLPGV